MGQADFAYTTHISHFTMGNALTFSHKKSLTAKNRNHAEIRRTLGEMVLAYLVEHGHSQIRMDDDLGVVEDITCTFPADLLDEIMIWGADQEDMEDGGDSEPNGDERDHNYCVDDGVVFPSIHETAI